MNRLKEIREERGLLQVDVCRDLGFGKSAMSYYEAGDRGLSSDLINKFCDYFNVTADYLLGRSAQPHASVSESDTELLAAYHRAPEEIRAIIDTALAPYREAKNEGTAAAS